MLHLLLHIFFAAMSSQSETLAAQAPIIVPGGPGSFDFMNFDATDRLAFACHPGMSAFAVINVDSGKVVSVDCGLKVNGIDSDPAGHRLFAAGPGNTLLQFDMRSWTKSASLSLSGPGDSVIYDQKRRLVYVDNDDGTTLWFVNPKGLTVENSVTIKEAPEVMVLDSGHNKIYQNIKTSNSLQVIDLNSKSVVAEYALGALTSPHGLAEDVSARKLFSVGKNGKLIILNADSGQILSTVDVTPNSDQIAYDPAWKRLYIPGSGIIQTVQITADGAKIIGSSSLPKGCHSVTVDTKTHNVWVAFADANASFVMKYIASK